MELHRPAALADLRRSRGTAATLALSLWACATPTTVQREPAPLQQPTARPSAPVPETPDPRAAEPALPEWAEVDETPEEPAPVEPGREIADAACALVGLKKLSGITRAVPDDCTGLARVAYEAAGVDLMAGGSRPGENGVSAIWRLARAARATHFDAPAPGDLVFFEETYDRNRDGKRNDGRTHIGVVESIDAEGTVFFVHRSGHGVTRSRLNLRRPGWPRNEVLRPAQGELRAYSTGELFAGYARPEPLRAVAPAAPRPLVVRRAASR